MLGGSGYLGEHLVRWLTAATGRCTYASREPLPAAGEGASEPEPSGDADIGPRHVGSAAVATSYRDTGGGSRRPSRAAFLLGLGVPLGWGFHDLAVFALTSRPEDARLLLPGIFLAVVVGGIVAPLLAGSRAFAALGMVVAFAGLVTPNLFDLAGSPTKLAQPGILGVALTAWFVAWLTTPKASDPAFPSRGSRFSPMRWGIAAGALGAALNTGLRVGPEQDVEWLASSTPSAHGFELRA